MVDEHSKIAIVNQMLERLIVFCIIVLVVTICLMSYFQYNKRVDSRPCSIKVNQINATKTYGAREQFQTLFKVCYTRD